MSGQVGPWRPVSPSDLAGVRTLAIEVFDAWFTRWVARPWPGATEATCSTALTRASRSDAMDWRIGNGIRFTLGESVIARAALLALDLPGLELAEDAEDARAILDALKKDMADDLVSSFASACGETVFDRADASGRFPTLVSATPTTA